MMARQTGGLWWGGTDLFPRSSAENRTATAAQAGSVSTTRNLSHAFTDGEWLDMSIITHPMRQYVDPPKGLPARVQRQHPMMDDRSGRLGPLRTIDTCYHMLPIAIRKQQGRTRDCATCPAGHEPRATRTGCRATDRLDRRRRMRCVGARARRHGWQRAVDM